jgi:putative transposase
MRGPKAIPIELRDAQRQGLETLLRRHSAPQQLVLRARIVLAAAAGRNNAQIVRDLAVDIGTARRWRGRWLGLQSVALADLSVEERLTDAPRSGKPAAISAEQTCQIVALACAAPAAAGRPISQWTGREVADEIVARGILPAISPRHAARLLKRGMSSPT